MTDTGKPVTPIETLHQRCLKQKMRRTKSSDTV